MYCHKQVLVLKHQEQIILQQSFKRTSTQNTIEIKFIPSSQTKLLCDLCLMTKKKLNTRQKTVIIIIHIFALRHLYFFPAMNFVKLISQRFKCDFLHQAAKIQKNENYTLMQVIKIAGSDKGCNEPTVEYLHDPIS